MAAVCVGLPAIGQVGLKTAIAGSQGRQLLLAKMIALGAFVQPQGISWWELVQWLCVSRARAITWLHSHSQVLVCRARAQPCFGIDLGRLILQHVSPIGARACGAGEGFEVRTTTRLRPPRAPVTRLPSRPAPSPPPPNTPPLAPSSSPPVKRPRIAPRPHPPHRPRHPPPRAPSLSHASPPPTRGGWWAGGVGGGGGRLRGRVGSFFRGGCERRAGGKGGGRSGWKGGRVGLFRPGTAPPFPPIDHSWFGNSRRF